MIYQDGEQKQTVLDTSCIVTGLNNGTQYTFMVKILSSSVSIIFVYGYKNGNNKL